MKQSQKSVIRLCVFALVAVFLFSSCGRGVQNTTTQTASTQRSSVTSSKTTASTKKNTSATTESGKKDFEDVNFFGKTFTFAVHVGADGKSDGEIYAEEDGAGFWDGYIYERNQIMYEYYNCKIETVEISSLSLAAELASGGGKIDFVNAKYGAVARNGENFYNFHEMDFGIDITFGNHGLMNSATVDGKLYAITSVFSLSYMDGIRILYFNKAVKGNIGALENVDFYDLLDKNEWTLDKFCELLKLAENSGFYGLVSTEQGIRDLYFGAGQGYAVKTDDANGNSRFSHGFTDIASVATDKILKIYGAEHNVIVEKGVPERIMKENGALFALGSLSDLKEYASVPVNCGVLPMPKLSARQANYVSTNDYSGAMLSAVKTGYDINMVADFLTLFSLRTAYYLYNGYMNLYRFTYTTDIESSGVIETILKNDSFDFAYLHGFENADELYVSAVLGGKNPVAELRESIGAGIEEAAMAYKNA
ncbi:MAG: hypothetical protein IJX55_07710 [Clostridia bacterium]|nr:hypothetical protein [Clostridia bacterium]